MEDRRARFWEVLDKIGPWLESGEGREMGGRVYACFLEF